jgi:hypothetical protein
MALRRVERLSLRLGQPTYRVNRTALLEVFENLGLPTEDPAFREWRRFSESPMVGK